MRKVESGQKSFAKLCYEKEMDAMNIEWRKIKDDEQDNGLLNEINEKW